jgi:hypothetical protein
MHCKDSSLLAGTELCWKLTSFLTTYVVMYRFRSCWTVPDVWSVTMMAVDFEDYFTSIIVCINSKMYPDVSSRLVYFVFKKDHPQ